MHAFVTTPLFRQRLEDAELDTIVLGEDCAAWLRAKLATGSRITAPDPIQEDWGWTIAVAVDGTNLWLNVQDWSFEKPQTWHVWLEARGLLARISKRRRTAAVTRIRESLDVAMSGDPAILECRWSNDLIRP